MNNLTSRAVTGVGIFLAAIVARFGWDLGGWLIQKIVN